MKKHLLFSALLAILPLAAIADDCGMELSAGVDHKFNKKVSISAEGEMRTRNDFRTFDRFSIGVDASYRLCKYAKISGGYSLLYDNNVEKISRDSDGEISKWTPSYWGLRHRFNVSLTGRIDFDRFTLSLRERWQYTYRPEAHTERYDFGDECWEEKAVKGTGKSVLRSRLRLEYNIPRCKVDPYVSAEIFNSMALDKTRIIVGADWKISKKHSLGFHYRYQIVNNSDSDGESNSHIIGIGYNYTF